MTTSLLPTPTAPAPTRVQCDCGRRVPLDMATDVSDLPATIRGERTVVCDGCRERWFRRGIVTRAELAMLLGAPATQIAAIAAKHREAPRRLRATLLVVLAGGALDRPRRLARLVRPPAPLTTRADVGAGDSVTPPTPTP